MRASNGPDALARWRAEVDTARSSRRLLDLLIGLPDAAARVPTLPVEDFYRLVLRIGLADTGELLPLASDEQIRGCVDLDAWAQDRIELSRLDRWLQALMHAGGDTLLRGVLALDDELINWIVRRSVQVVVVEDPDSFQGPDEEHVLTPDGRLCTIFPESAPRDLPAKVLLDALMRTDPAFCYNLLLGAAAALDSNLEEAAYRWRRGRMADLGYVDLYEALQVYTPPRPDEIAAARDGATPHLPPPTCWLRPILEPEARLAAAFAALPAEALPDLHAALSHLANTALAADRVEPWQEDAVEPVLRRVRAGLVLGLDALAGGAAPDPRVDAGVLERVALTTIFRTGYGRTQRAAAPILRSRRAGRLTGPGGPLDAVDTEPLRSWAQALAERHPSRPDGAPLATPDDLRAAATQAGIIEELAALAGDARPPNIGLSAFALTALTRALLELAGPGPLPVERLEPAHRALFADGALRAEARGAAGDAWPRIGGRTPEALAVVLHLAEQELAAVEPARLEPRFIRAWWVA